MPAPCEFRRSVELDAPIARVYEFHADPRSIPAISPSWQRVEIKRGGKPAHVGEKFEIVVRFFGVVAFALARGLARGAGTIAAGGRSLAQPVRVLAAPARIFPARGRPHPDDRPCQLPFSRPLDR